MGQDEREAEAKADKKRAKKLYTEEDVQALYSVIGEAHQTLERLVFWALKTVLVEHCGFTDDGAKGAARKMVEDCTFPVEKRITEWAMAKAEKDKAAAAATNGTEDPT